MLIPNSQLRHAEEESWDMFSLGGARKLFVPVIFCLDGAKNRNGTSGSLQGIVGHVGDHLCAAPQIPLPSTYELCCAGASLFF